MRPPLTHALRTLDGDGPLCGARESHLVASLLPTLVTCPDCQKRLMHVEAPGSSQEPRSVQQVPMEEGEAKRVLVDARGAHPRVSEKMFLEQIRQVAREAGYLMYHPHRSEHSEAGWPDLVLAKPGKPLILSELKSAKGRLTRAQRQWLEVLAQTEGVVVCVWRPADLERIRHVLTQE